MQKYSKKLMAIFGVLLMIVFILPTTMKNQMGHGEAMVGSIGKEKVTVADVSSAQSRWQALQSQIFFAYQPYPGARVQLAPMAYRILGPLDSPALGQVIQQLNASNHRPMFYLLLREARAMGARVSEDDLRAELSQVYVKQADGKPAAVEDLPEEPRTMTEQAVTDLLMIREAFTLASNAAKVSQPLAQNELAKRDQQIKLHLIDFAASDYMAQVAPPTTQALQQQFDKYADMVSAEFNPLNSDPFGFGYKYPDRVKIQFIGVPRDQVRKVVKSTPPPGAVVQANTPEEAEYLWNVEAQKYYRRHLEEFATSQPATSQPSTQLSMKPAATTRPFAEVRSEILERLIEPEVDKLANSIQTRITSALANDFQAYKTAHPTTASATSAPTTAAAAGYASFDYLKNLAAQIQRETKVLPTVASYDERFLNEKDLAALPGIGSSTLKTRDESLAFNVYATQFPAAFHPNAPEPLQLLQPSRPLTALDQSLYTFRISAADPSHRPANLQEVAAEVEKDLKTKAAYDLALEAAKSAQSLAKDAGLQPAAVKLQRTVQETTYFGSDAAITGYAVSPGSEQTFTTAAFKLLADAAKDRSAVIGLIELPRDRKAVVAQLADVRLLPGLTADALPQEQIRAMRDLRMALRQTMSRDWFTYSNVLSRTGFHDNSERGGESAEE
jgi:hypothetical protein